MMHPDLGACCLAGGAEPTPAHSADSGALQYFSLKGRSFAPAGYTSLAIISSPAADTASTNSITLASRREEHLMVCCSVPPALLSSALSGLLLHYYIAIALRFITLLAGHTMSASPQPSPAPPQVFGDRKKQGDSAAPCRTTEPHQHCS